MKPYAQIAASVDLVRDGLINWVEDLLSHGGVTLPVVGTVGKEPGLVLLPYQMLVEGQLAMANIPLLPLSGDSDHSSIPTPWRLIGRGMTRVLLESYPRRKIAGRPETVNPCPPVEELPNSIRYWYEENADNWVVDNGGVPCARLPALAWRLPFAFAVRYAAMVIAPPTGAAIDRLDAQQLKALALLAAGLRIERYFTADAPADPVSDEIIELIHAFAGVPIESQAELHGAIEACLAPRRVKVGIAPHNELTDSDLALVAMALRQPMQPALVFSVRMTLGGGPILEPGGLPNIAPVGKGGGGE